MLGSCALVGRLELLSTMPFEVHSVMCPASKLLDAKCGYTIRQSHAVLCQTF